ncbi:N-alpha-acetyltransferase, non-catalitic subunit [Sorochytrium milnesiophthora]
MSSAASFSDVTERFRRAASDLADGQLARSESLSLYDAMTATEIMDPKMDSGLATLEEKSDRIVLDEAFVRKSQPSDKQLLQILDATYLRGSPAAQTIFTSIYMHHPLSISNKPLRAFVHVLLKLNSGIKNLAHNANVYEEEDFVTEMHHFNLLDDISETSTLIQLHSCLNDLSQCKTTKNAELISFIAMRLVLVRCFLEAFVCLSTRRYAEAQRALEKMSSTIQQLMLPSVAKYAYPSGDRAAMRALGVDPMLNKRLTTYGPLRVVPLLPQTEALSFLQQIADNLLLVTHARHCTRAESLLTFVHQFSVRPTSDAISRCFLQYIVFNFDMLVLGEIPLQQLLLGWMERTCGMPYLARISAPSASDRHAEIEEAKTRLLAFLKRCEAVVMDILRIYTHNRSRQRRLLGKAIALWDALHLEVETVDAELEELLGETHYPSYLSAWTLHVKVSLMLDFILAGFETQLHKPFELPTMYWYLGHVYSTALGLHQHTARLRVYARTGDVEALRSADGARRGPVPSSPQDTLANDLASMTLSPTGSGALTETEAQSSLTAARWNMAEALFAIIVVLSEHGYLPTLSFDRAVAEKRYNQRVRHLAAVTIPTPLTFAEFEKACSQLKVHIEVKVTEALQQAYAQLEQCKAHLDRVLKAPNAAALLMVDADWEHYKQDLQHLAKTCIANMVGVKTLLARLKATSSEPGAATTTISVALEFRYTAHFCVITVK